MHRQSMWDNKNLEQAVQIVRRGDAPFRNESDLLETTRVLFELRSQIRNSYDPDEVVDAPALEKKLRNVLHARLALTNASFPLVKRLKERRYSRLEIEVVLLLVISSLGMFERVSDVDDVQKAMLEDGNGALNIIRALSEDSRLHRAHLISTKPDNLPTQMSVEVGHELLSLTINPKNKSDVWKVRTQAQFLEKCGNMFSLLAEKSDQFNERRAYFHTSQERDLIERNLARQVELAWKTLRRHSNWPIHKALHAEFDVRQLRILFALLGKALGAVDSSDELFTGEGLARTLSQERIQIQKNLRLLKQSGNLRSKGYIQVCGGYGDSLAMEDEASLMTCEFELTDEFLESIKTKRKRNRMRESARTPKVTMKQVVHTEETRAAIQLAITQTQHGAVLMDDWGLAGTVTYGRSVSVLFSGPPGVGKTATAEAIAHELSKKILVANYAEIQNCFVGQTEKNISRFFREARESDAVLFWDEADSMFFDRNSAYRNWEVREVNQLLMELEKFEGLCILATNRTVTLDKALQRRIAIKVEFQPPDADMRMQIWRKLIPKKLPLDKDIDWETLADTELTGGEIKNSVLNASRFALVRGPQGPVTMNDFEKAISLEVDGRWGESRTGVIGFGR